jgi:hypothetical protein
MALTVIPGNVAITQDQRTLSWTLPTVAVGDVVAVAAMTWDQGNTLNAPTGTGLSFTLRAEVNFPNRTHLYIWTAVATSGGSSVVVTCSVLAATNSVHNGTAYVCPTADGYSLAATPNTATNTNGTNPTTSLAGASGNLGIIIAGDWNAVNGSTRAWQGTVTEDMYQFSSGNSTQYGAHMTLTGATTTVGLSSPSTGVSPAIAAMEVLKSGGSTPVIPELVMAPRTY